MPAVDRMLLKEDFFFSHAKRRQQNFWFFQQSLLTIWILPGVPGRKVLMLSALSHLGRLWAAQLPHRCKNLQDAAICLSFEPCGECVI